MRRITQRKTVTIKIVTAKLTWTEEDGFVQTDKADPAHSEAIEIIWLEPGNTPVAQPDPPHPSASAISSQAETPETGNP